MNKNITAIIPMKAHSERVRNKNFRDFNGKPLFYWIFNTLKKVSYINKIILDTDSEELGEKVLEFFPDVEISIRPIELCGDFVSVNRLIGYNIDKYKENNIFIQTHSTNPCLKAETIEKAIEFFLNNNKKYDSIFSVNRIQTRLYKKDFSPLNHDPKNLIRTQDLDPLYEENSNFYIFTKESFDKTKARIGENPFLFEMNELESKDIDTEEDFLLSEVIHDRYFK